jgi:hypothetical protein
MGNITVKSYTIFLICAVIFAISGALLESKLMFAIGGIMTVVNGILLTRLLLAARR